MEAASKGFGLEMWSESQNKLQNCLSGEQMCQSVDLLVSCFVVSSGELFLAQSTNSTVTDAISEAFS